MWKSFQVLGLQHKLSRNPGESSPPDNGLRSSDSSALLAYLGASSAFSGQPSATLRGSQVLPSAGPLQSSAVIGVSHAASPISRAAVLVRQPQPSNSSGETGAIFESVPSSTVHDPAAIISSTKMLLIALVDDGPDSQHVDGNSSCLYYENDCNADCWAVLNMNEWLPA